MRDARVLFALMFLLTLHARGGGPLVVGGPAYGRDGTPFVWDAANMPIRYTVDAGPLSTNAGAVVIDNAAGVARVQTMFGVWENVATASIADSYAGPILGSNGQPVDIATIQQFNDALGTCSPGRQNPIVFDADGALLTALGLGSNVIGFASVCLDSRVGAGKIIGGFAVMNGAWIDGSTSNGELPNALFNTAITHELGHFQAWIMRRSIRTRGCSIA